MADRKEEMNEKTSIVPETIDENTIKAEIYVIRGQKVMLDFDLSRIYGYETKYLNRQVQRNKEKFPDDFMFRLTAEETSGLRCQNGTTSWEGQDICLIRGRKVMLDHDLAAIYGYETKAFNRQVRNNLLKFEGEEFMFRLTREEAGDLVRCKNFTSRNAGLFQGQSGGSRYRISCLH